KADPDYRPILTIGDADEEETALFRLHDGTLRLENLEFRLRPANDQFKSQAVVAIQRDGFCAFKNCVITLEERRKTDWIATVVLGDPAAAMKMDPKPTPPSEQLPRIQFDNCFVRGDGDLLHSRSGRPFQFEGRNTLAALGGSFFHLDAAREEGMTAYSARGEIKLNHVTACVNGHLLHAKTGKDLKGPVAASFEPTGNRFFP